MKCFQDRELHGQLLFLLPLTLVAAWVGFSLAPQAGYLALGLCALFGLTLVWSAWRRYQTMGGPVPGPGSAPPRGHWHQPGRLR